jgi:CHAT domain-containing protein
VSSIDLRVLNAPQSLLAMANPAAAGGRALVVGGPDFGGAPRRGSGSERAVTLGSRLQDLWFVPLPGALAEAASVGRLLQAGGGATVLTGAQATKQGVFAAPAPRVLHLATHGYFLDDVRALDEDEDPMQALALSGLALRGANVALTGAGKGTREGLLTALEVTALDLRRTQLVVLSACETGLGRLQNGEGVLGLTRAFHEAGARFVLSTLWSIDDEGTKAFMDTFYAEIAAGRAPAEALSAARQSFLRHPRFSDPYYWAPFVLTGA